MPDDTEGDSKGKDNLNWTNNNDDLIKSDEEKGQEKELPYPKHVFFVLVNEFCERFSYYGMRAILIIYLTNILKYSDNDATVIYHIFIVFAYFTPFFGAMIADSLLGKFRTILYLSVVYAAGQVLLTVSSTEEFKIPQIPFSLVGMMLIAIGTGGIKPCVSAFGGDQFIMPQQEDKLGTFFSIFYFSINCGSLLSTFLTPIFREDIKCFNEDSCYPLAFGVPAALMITSVVVFLIGSRWYTIRKPEGNVVWMVLRAIGHALSQKWKSKEKKEHWLDYSIGKFTKREIRDVKIVLGVLFLYIPLPVFWTLYDQQGSRWTLQATRMKGDIGPNFTIKPDQMQVLSSLLILLFIPLFDKGIYPLLGKCGIIKKPLQRLVMGGIFAGLSFIISGVIELELQKTYPVKISYGEAHLHFVNMAQTNLSATLTKLEEGGISENFELEQYHNFVKGIVSDGEYELKLNNFTQNFTFTTVNGEASTILIAQIVNPAGEPLNFILPGSKFNDSLSDSDLYTDTIEKHSDGNPYFRVIQFGLWKDPEQAGPPYNDTNVIIKKNHEYQVIMEGDKTETFEFSQNYLEYSDWKSTPTIEMEIDEYTIHVKDPSGTVKLGSVELKLGGSYVLAVVRNSDGNYNYTVNILQEPNSMHMAWLVPQYIVLSAGEIMFSITIMDFSYSQAPKSMKSVMQSAWLMTVAVGNLITVIIAELQFFEEQWKEFFLFAGLMFVDMIIFAFMAYRYKPANFNDEEEETEDKIESVKDDEKYD